MKVCVGVRQKRVNIKRKHNVGHDDFLIKCNIGCKKHTAYRSLIALSFSQALLQWKFYEQMVAFIQCRNLELHKIQTFQTCQFNKNGLFFGLKSEHSCSGKERKTNARFMDGALKRRGVKYLNVETWLLFAPHIKISGYAPGRSKGVRREGINAPFTLIFYKNFINYAKEINCFHVHFAC